MFEILTKVEKTLQEKCDDMQVRDANLGLVEALDNDVAELREQLQSISNMPSLCENLRNSIALKEQERQELLDQLN